MSAEISPIGAFVWLKKAATIKAEMVAAKIIDFLAVGIGSSIGGVCRYYVSGLLTRSYPDAIFPLGTLAVNVIGCAAMGIICGIIEQNQAPGGHWRLLLVTGVLGGFTTFSAFGFETIALLRSGAPELALLNIAASLALCLAAVWLGIKATQFL